MAQRHEYENQKQVICEWAYVAIYGFLLSFFVVESWRVSKVSSFEFSQLQKFRPRDHF